MLDVLLGLPPSPYEDLNLSYHAPRWRFILLSFSISLGLSAIVEGFVFRSSNIYAWLALAGSVLFFIGWVLVNLSAYVYWLRRERIRMIEEFTAPKPIPEPEPTSPEESAPDMPEWLAKIWNGKTV